MLQNQRVLFEEGELIPSNSIPSIIKGYIEWYIENAKAAGLDEIYILDEFSRLTEEHSSFQINGPLLRLMEETITDVNLILEEHSLERVGEEQHKTLLELHELSSDAAKMIVSIKQTFDNFNKQTMKEGDMWLEVNTPELRLCQLPGCNKELNPKQHHAAKYCLECQTNGNVKRFYNKRHNIKIKRLTEEL